MRKPTLYIMVGLPGCGKSTLAAKLDAVVVSSDAIRGELFGSEAKQYDIPFAKRWLKNHPEVKEEETAGFYKRICNQCVFQTVENRILDSLQNGQNTVFDATNLNQKNRIHFIRKIKNANIIACYFDVPFKECWQRNCRRDRKVPYHIMQRMANNLQKPVKSEGFDDIRTYTK